MVAAMSFRTAAGPAQRVIEPGGVLAVRLRRLGAAMLSVAARTAGFVRLAGRRGRRDVPIAGFTRGSRYRGIVAPGTVVTGPFLGIAGRGDRDRFGVRPLGRTHLDIAGLVPGDGGDIAGEHHPSLASERARDLDPAFGDGDRRTFVSHLDGEDGALDEGDRVGGADGEMGGRLAFDPEQGAAVILDHLDEAARLGGGRQAHSRRRRDDHIFLPPNQHRAAAGARRDDVAGGELAAARRGEDQAGMADLDRPRRLGDPPGRSFRRRGRAAPQGKKPQKKVSPHRRRSCRRTHEAPDKGAKP
jgi:hypothetical protein